MSNLRVLIVGASIAGPTAAYWFARAGASVTVIERYPELRKGGQNIDIRTSGVTVMRKMGGMEATVRANLSPMEGISFVRENGQRFATIKPTGNPDQQSIVSEYEIFRGDLARILFDLTKDNEKVKYVFGEQVASMHQKGDFPITVEFANGKATTEYDLVVACDGATSRTRAIGLDCSVRDFIEPTNCWAAYYSVKQDLLGGSRIGQAYSTVGGRFFSIGPDRRDGVSRVTLMALNRREIGDATIPFRQAAQQGDEALKHYVAKHFGAVGWKSAEMIAGMDDSPDFYASELVQVKVPQLYKGRFVLVGDAGYAPGFTGAGTSLALTGAYVLAGEVSKHNGNLAAGIKAYDERMRPIIADMQKIPPGVPGLMAPQTHFGILMRNLLFIVVAWGTSFSKLLSWATKFFSSSFGKDKYGIPDYEWVE